jgi:PAS domain S-box-containing protein
LFLQQIINAIPYPLYVKNINEEFVLINNSFAEFLGVDRQEVLQYKFNKKTAVDETKLKLFEPDYEIYLTRKPMHFSEHELINSTTGKRHWLQTIKVPLHDSDGNLYEILSVSTDITEVKERELRLK